jgi:hypothetical protein
MESRALLFSTCSAIKNVLNPTLSKSRKCAQLNSLQKQIKTQYYKALPVASWLRMDGKSLWWIRGGGFVLFCLVLFFPYYCSHPSSQSPLLDRNAHGLAGWPSDGDKGLFESGP